jgi:hypothetical protein
LIELVDLSVEISLLCGALLIYALARIGHGVVSSLLGWTSGIFLIGDITGFVLNDLNKWLEVVSKASAHWPARLLHGIGNNLVAVFGVIYAFFYAWFIVFQWVYYEITGAFGTAAVKKLVADQNNAGHTTSAAATAAAASLVALKAQVTKLERELAIAGSSAATATEAAKVPVLQHDLTQLGKHVATVEASLTALRKEVTVIEQAKPATVPVPAPVAVPGATGATGAQGAQGAAGREGTPGTAGAAGVAGAPGIGIGDIDLPGLGTLTAGAAIATTYAIVNTLVNEAGLSRAECRGKVKQICGTDANEWANLLGGLAAIGFAFNLGELAKVANGLVSELEPVIKAAA